MLVKIWLYLTKAVITGDVDEVRVQSEEPNLKSLLLKQAFCFSASLKLTLNRIQPGNHLNLKLESVQPRHADPGQRRVRRFPPIFWQDTPDSVEV